MSKAALSVFGLGYVGCVSAACFADRGHSVVGVDVNREKMGFLGQGKAPLVEERIGELTAAAVAAGRLRVDADVRRAIHNTSISIICVGTPSGAGGGLSTEYLERASAQIGTALADKDDWHVVAYRSTMVPGTCEDLLIPLLERASGKRAGVDFGVCVNPEFLREGSSVRDFFDPPKTVVGESDPRSGAEVVALYDGLPGPRFRVPIGVAETTKYIDNSFHALKVGFANEIGALCVALGLDSHAVIDIFLADTKLNISPTYLRPGFAFGGSCLPKDLRALIHTARRNNVEMPVLSNVLVSNEAHLRRAVDSIIALGRRKIGVFGLSFKAGTDDMRESPMVELVERLFGKGYDIRVFDPTVSLSRLLGANRAFIDDRLPHVGDLLCEDVDAVLAHADILVVGSRDDRVVAAIAKARPEQIIFDLVRLPDAAARRGSVGYVGIGW